MGGYLWSSLSNFEPFSSTASAKVGGPSREGKAVVGVEETEPLTSPSVDRDGMVRYSATRQLRHAIWLGLICDFIDVCGGLACLLESGMGGRAIVLVYGGAALFASIGTIGVRAVRGL